MIGALLAAGLKAAAPQLLEAGAAKVAGGVAAKSFATQVAEKAAAGSGNAAIARALGPKMAQRAASDTGQKVIKQGAKMVHKQVQKQTRDDDPQPPATPSAPQHGRSEALTSASSMGRYNSLTRRTQGGMSIMQRPEFGGISPGGFQGVTQNRPVAQGTSTWDLPGGNALGRVQSAFHGMSGVQTPDSSGVGAPSSIMGGFQPSTRADSPSMNFATRQPTVHSDMYASSNVRQQRAGDRKGHLNAFGI